MIFSFFSFFHFFSFFFPFCFPFCFPVVFLRCIPLQCPVVVPWLDASSSWRLKRARARVSGKTTLQGSKSSSQTLSGRSPRAFFYIVFSILSVFVHCFLNIFIFFFFFSMCSSFFHAPDSKQIPNLLTAVAAVSWFFPIFFACIFYFSLFFSMCSSFFIDFSMIIPCF